MGTLLNLSSALSLSNFLLLLFVLALGALIGFALLKYIDEKNRIKNAKFNNKNVPTLLTVSLGIEILAALYLLIFDENLFNSWLHWFGLLVFTSINIALLVDYLSSTVKSTIHAIKIWSLIGVIAMVLDFTLNLPFSQFAGPIGGLGGVNYLFGFGAAGTGGTFGVSFVFSLFLIFTVVSFSSSLLKSLEKEHKRKR